MKVTVVGDVLLDRDVHGTSERLSPDAPVPVVDVERTEQRAGGAGLVARMLARDGHDVTLVTVLGEDASAGALRAALEGIEVVAGPSGAPTPVKSRVHAHGQPVVRIDEGCAPPAAPAVTDAMLDALRSAEAIIAADYGRRLLEHEGLRAALRERAAVVPLVWDPHPRGTAPVAGSTATPNHAEARAAAGLAGAGIAAAQEAAAVLGRRWSADIVVTIGERGAVLADGSVLPAPRVESADPCGAGDRFAASLALALAGGARLPDAADRAVRDAAAYLRAGGVAGLLRPTTVPLRNPASDALEVVERVRAAGGTVVATGGCFDLLHAGHARTLSAARALGDCLVVCLNSDGSVRRLKGAERPIQSQDDRAALLEALGCVDAVLVFEEDTPVDALRRLRPDLWVKGGDYDAEALPETAVLAEWGARTVTVPFHPGRSTTRLAGALARVG